MKINGLRQNAEVWLLRTPMETRGYGPQKPVPSEGSVIRLNKNCVVVRDRRTGEEFRFRTADDNGNAADTGPGSARCLIPPAAACADIFDDRDEMYRCAEEMENARRAECDRLRGIISENCSTLVKNMDYASLVCVLAALDPETDEIPAAEVMGLPVT